MVQLKRLAAASSLIVAALVMVLSQAGAASAAVSPQINRPIYFSDHTWDRGVSISSNTVTLTFQTDGNLVLYHNGQALWATGTNGIFWDAQHIFWASDGDIYIQGGSGNNVCWIPGLQASSVPGGTAMIQDDGNFVLYDADNNAVWASNTDGFRQGSTNLCYGFDYEL